MHEIELFRARFTSLKRSILNINSTKIQFSHVRVGCASGACTPQFCANEVWGFPVNAHYFYFSLNTRKLRCFQSIRSSVQLVPLLRFMNQASAEGKLITPSCKVCAGTNKKRC